MDITGFPNCCTGRVLFGFDNTNGLGSSNIDELTSRDVAAEIVEKIQMASNAGFTLTVLREDRQTRGIVIMETLGFTLLETYYTKKYKANLLLYGFPNSKAEEIWGNAEAIEEMLSRLPDDDNEE